MCSPKCKVGDSKKLGFAKEQETLGLFNTISKIPMLGP